MSSSSHKDGGDSKALQEHLEIKFADVAKKNDGILDSGMMCVKVRFNRDSQNQEEVQQCLRELEDVYAKNKPFLILYDASRITNVNLSDLDKLGVFVKSKESETKRLVQGCAVVITNTIVLGLVKPVLFIKKPTCPLLVCKKLEQAEEFLRRHNPDTLKK